VLPVSPEPIALFDADRRVREMAEAWKTTESYATGSLGADHFLSNVKSDHASDIMEAMWGNQGKSFYINSPNRGAITNLAPDAFVALIWDRVHAEYSLVLDVINVAAAPVALRCVY